MVAQSAKNRPIWSHWRRVFFKSVHFLPPLPSYLQLVSTIVRDSKVPRFPPPSSKVFISWLETFLPREIFGARAHALGDGNSRDGSGRARARDETVGAHPKKKKNQFFCCRSRLKKIGKSFAQSVRHFHSEPMKLFQEENVIFCLRNWSPSHIYFFHLGGTRIRESATAAFSVNHTWSADCLRTRARDILARKW